MDENAVRQIADKVFHDTAFYIALVSLIGVVIGSALSILGNYLTQHAALRAESKRDQHQQPQRRELLLTGDGT